MGTIPLLSLKAPWALKPMQLRRPWRAFFWILSPVNAVIVEEWAVVERKSELHVSMCRRAPPMTCEKTFNLEITNNRGHRHEVSTGGTDSGESKPSALKCQFLLGFRLLYFGNIGKSENSAKYRHVPGSQPSFSLIQDPEQNKEDHHLFMF